MPIIHSIITNKVKTIVFDGQQSKRICVTKYNALTYFLLVIVLTLVYHQNLSNTILSQIYLEIRIQFNMFR